MLARFRFDSKTIVLKQNDPQNRKINMEKLKSLLQSQPNNFMAMIGCFSPIEIRPYGPARKNPKLLTDEFENQHL